MCIRDRYNIDYSVPQETLTQANNPVKNVPDDRTTAPAQTTKEDDSKNTPYTGSYALPMGTDIRKDYSCLLYTSGRRPSWDTSRSPGRRGSRRRC